MFRNKYGETYFFAKQKRRKVSSSLDFRPICIQNSLVSIYERALAKAILNFALEHNCIDSRCHGFLPGRSVHTAIKEITENYEKGRGSMKILLAFDISKAFDKIDIEFVVKMLLFLIFQIISSPG